MGEQLQLGRDTMTRALRELSLNRAIVKVERDVALSAAAEAHARELVAAAIEAAGGAATTSVLREALGVSRKRAISILEHLDAVRFTVLDKDAGGLQLTCAQIRTARFGQNTAALGNGWAPVGSAVLKTVARRAKRLGCVRFTYVPAIRYQRFCARGLAACRKGAVLFLHRFAVAACYYRRRYLASCVGFRACRWRCFAV